MRTVWAWCAAAFVAVTGTQANAAWYEAKSKHFVIYANERPDELRAYAEKLERFDQAVRYIRQMDDPALTDAGRVKIFVLPDGDAIARLVGLDYAAGMYETRASGSFAFVPRTMDVPYVGSSQGIATLKSILQPQAIFFHEYSHHLQLQNASAVVPTWLAEGFAEFFASAEIAKNGTVTIGKFPQYRWWGVHDRGSIPIEQMVGVTYDKKLTGEQMEVLYARGWLLTDYLAMSDSRKGQLTHYLEGIQSGMTPLESAKVAFGDLKVLQHDMDAYSRQLTAIDIDAKVIPIGDVAIHPLGPGEAAIMDVRIHSKRGVDQKTAPEVAAEARRIATSYPSDPTVQGTLAEAEYDAKNYAAADAAADRALAADPNDVHALIYKGRALTAEARANPKLANWNGIRSWFLKANKLDTENAEPLALYYDSFVAAGQQPTQNAVDALLYAVDLAPRDNQVRMTAVALLLAQDKLQDAKAMLAPIAYQPHLPPEMQELASKIMSAIGAGDVKTAIGLLSQKAEKPVKP
jgi:hypothetical protein